MVLVRITRGLFEVKTLVLCRIHMLDVLVEWIIGFSVGGSVLIIVIIVVVRLCCRYW